MSSHISIHDATRLIARPGGTSGAPLKIECRGPEGEKVAELVIFLDDFALVERLAFAINDAMTGYDERRELIETLEATGYDLTREGDADWRGTMTDADLRQAVAMVEADAA